MAPVREILDLHRRLNGSLIEPSWSLGRRISGRLGGSNNFPSCLKRGPRGGRPGNRRSPLALFAGEPTARLYGHAAEVLGTRHGRFLVMPTGKGFMQLSLRTAGPTKGGQHDRGIRKHERAID